MFYSSLTFILFTFKIQQLFNQQTWVYSEVAENCNSGHSSYDKTIGHFGEQRRTFFYRGKGKLEGAVYPQRVRWREVGVRSVVAFHWLDCDSLSLAGLSLGEEKIFLPPTPEVE